jgi:DnaK suppressor protein
MTAPLEVARGDAPGHLHPTAYVQLIERLEHEQRLLADQLTELEAGLQGHTASSADDVAERDLVELHATRTRESLESVEAALDRMRARTFGVCVGCGDPIPVERLEAVPDARYCVACPGPRRRLG